MQMVTRLEWLPEPDGAGASRAGVKVLPGLSEGNPAGALRCPQVPLRRGIHWRCLYHICHVAINQGPAAVRNSSIHLAGLEVITFHYEVRGVFII